MSRFKKLPEISHRQASGFDQIMRFVFDPKEPIYMHVHPERIHLQLAHSAGIGSTCPHSSTAGHQLSAHWSEGPSNFQTAYDRHSNWASPHQNQLTQRLKEAFVPSIENRNSSTDWTPSTFIFRDSDISTSSRRLKVATSKCNKIT